MTDQQKVFRKCLDNHCVINHAFFTSNDFHTIWNAMSEYLMCELPDTQEQEGEAERRIPTKDEDFEFENTDYSDGQRNGFESGAHWMHNKVKDLVTIK